jgi:putative ABC transport system ATP-binding protein
MALLRTEGLGKRFRVGEEEVAAVREVALSIQPGEFVGITGPSGSGKSTLMALLAGLERPSEGEVFFEEQPLSALSDAELSRLRRRRIGFVFQTFNLVPVLTLEENVALPFVLERMAPSEWKGRVRAALEQVGLGHRALHLPERVSVGERQRAAIARALVTGPRLVFADEPTGSLDSQRGEEVLALLRQACEREGRTVVMVTHDPKAAAIADRLIRIRDGRVEAHAP